MADEMNVEGAAAAYEAALELAPDDVRCIDALAELAFQQGDLETAEALFTRGVELAPDGHYSRHLYLGQLLQGDDAAAAFKRGISLVEALLSSVEAPPREEVLQLKRELSKACCSLAELYMTDLCENDGAEQLCENFASRAVEEDGANAEAYRVLADLRLCQQRVAESKPLLLRTVQLLESCYPPDDGADGSDPSAAAAKLQHSSSSSVSSAADAAAPTEDALASLPPYPSRMRAAQIAMELELYESAITMLDRLLAEDDSNMEVWYLIAEAHLHSGDAEAAVEVLQLADEMLGTALQQLSARAAAAAAAAKNNRGKGKSARAAAVASKRAQSTLDDEGLLRYGADDLKVQRVQIRKLLNVAQAKLGGGSSSSSASSSSGSSSSSSCQQQQQHDAADENVDT